MNQLSHHSTDKETRQLLAEEVRQELRNQLTSLSSLSQWAILPVILLVISALWDDLSHGALFAWTATTLLVSVVGFINNRINLNRSRRQRYNDGFQTRNMLYFCMVGLVWGSLPLLTAVWGSESANWHVLIISLAFMTAQVLVLSTSHRIFFCTLIPSGLLVLLSMITGPLFSIELLMLTLLYLTALILMHNTLYQIHLERVQSSVHNAAQANRLADTLEYHDAMTGLFNKTGLARWLALYPWNDENYRPVTLVLASIKGLSEINVLYGSATVDELLGEIASQLLHSGGERLCLARLSGAEFLLVDAGPDAEIGRLSEILAALENQTFTISGRKINISVQQTAVQGTAGELDQLIEIARSYLEIPGSDSPSLQLEKTTRLDFRRELVMGFHEALAAGRISPWFQPIFDCNTGAISGWEALVRWQHEGYGSLHPEQFLDIARISGQAEMLTRNMFENCVQFISRLQQQGCQQAARVSINFTAGDLASPATPGWISETLEKYQVDPTLLCIEISEKEALLKDKQFSSNLQYLKQLGISLAIDDFGTGYANLSQLLDLPASVIKLDKCFVEQLPDDAQSVALIRAIITMASSLQMRTIAEGVERREQLNFLRQQGCDAYQGFLTSEPLSVDQAMQAARVWCSNTYQPDQQTDA